MYRCSEEDFYRLKKEYNEKNNSFKKVFIFHVGQAAGFYSELGAMLYADDANFSQNGWEDFFEPFCEMNHNKWNHYFNRRVKKVHLIPRMVDWLGKQILLRSCHADYLTYDLFDRFVHGLGEEKTEWKELDISGVADNEVKKFIPFAMRYNTDTQAEVNKQIEDLNLPPNYVSVHIRGGDKLADQSKSISVEECMEYMEKVSFIEKDIFVFTDDYHNVDVIRERHKEWNVYTLTKKEEKGYDNNQFNVLAWENRKCELIKLFAIMEICINSKIHFGYEHACSNGIIKLCREGREYYPMYSKEYILKENKK